MSDIGYLRLDGNALRQFLTVYEIGSVTAAALRLGIGQSAVSHTLDRLRGLLGDPLFVRQGRGIVPTERAHTMAEQVRRILPALEALTQPDTFDPAGLSGQVAIGADDFERELFGPDLCRRIWQQAPDLDVQFLSPGENTSEALRSGRCDLVLSPALPDGSEFMQCKLFSDRWAVFYSQGTAPDTTDLYSARNHAKVVFSDNDTSAIDRHLARAGVSRRVAVRVDSFLALNRLMDGTDLITTLPTRAARTFMTGFSTCAPPIEIAEISFHLLWHASQHHSPRSRWLRDIVVDMARTVGR